MDGIDRRGVIKVAGLLFAAGAVGVPPLGASAAVKYNTNVDETLFASINRAKDPSKMTPLEAHHAPVITVPASVKAGEPFMAEVSVGKELHVTTGAHRIVTVELMAGNEPIGTVVFESLSAMPRVSFLVALDKPVTLVAQARCNLHGLWEGTVDVNLE